MFWGNTQIYYSASLSPWYPRLVSGPVFPSLSVGNCGSNFRDWRECLQPCFRSLFQSLHLLDEAFPQCLGRRAVAYFGSIKCISLFLTVPLRVVSHSEEGESAGLGLISCERQLSAATSWLGKLNQRLSNLQKRRQIFRTCVLYLLSRKKLTMNS